MKKILTILVLSIISITVGCATQVHDVEFGYFAKAQERRPQINDVFFNTTHSAYKKYRVYPDEEVPAEEIAVFDQKKLPDSHHPVDNDTMEGILKGLEDQQFFAIGRSVDSFKQAIQIFKSENFIKQCFVLIVDGNVTIAIPPRSLGPNAREEQVKEFQKIMDKFRIYGAVYAKLSELFRRSKVEMSGGLHTFIDDIERTHELGEEERDNIDEHRSERDRLHGNN